MYTLQVRNKSVCQTSPHKRKNTILLHRFPKLAHDRVPQCNVPHACPHKHRNTILLLRLETHNQVRECNVPHAKNRPETGPWDQNLSVKIHRSLLEHDEIV